MHILKLKGADCKPVLEEASREHKSKVGTIDDTRTYMNYNLAPEGQKVHDAEGLKERIKQLGVTRKIKDDAVLACTCIIDLPKDCDVPVEEFMKSAYKSLVKELCNGNEALVIQAEVHMDEKTPHMHFSFIPIVEKDGKIKLSAKEKLTKAFLREFHPNVEKSMQEDLNAPVCLYNEEKCREREAKRNRGDFSGEYVSLTEYKATKEKEAYLEEIQAETNIIEGINADKWRGIELLEEELEEKSKKKQTLEADINEGTDVLREMREQYKALREEKAKLTLENINLSKEVESLQGQVASAKKERETIFEELSKAVQGLINSIKKLERQIFWIRDKEPEKAERYEEKGNKLYNKGISELGNLNYTKAKETAKELEELADEIDGYER